MKMTKRTVTVAMTAAALGGLLGPLAEAQRLTMRPGWGNAGDGRGQCRTTDGSAGSSFEDKCAGCSLTLCQELCEADPYCLAIGFSNARTVESGECRIYFETMSRTSTDETAVCLDFVRSEPREPSSREGWSPSRGSGRGLCRTESGGARNGNEVCSAYEPCSFADCQRRCEDEQTCQAIEYRNVHDEKGICELHYRQMTGLEEEDTSLCYSLVKPLNLEPKDANWAKVGDGLCRNEDGNKVATRVACPVNSKCSIQRCQAKCEESADCVAVDFTEVNQRDVGLCTLQLEEVYQVEEVTLSSCYRFSRSQRPSSTDLDNFEQRGNGMCLDKHGRRGAYDTICDGESQCTLGECGEECAAVAGCKGIEFMQVREDSGICLLQFDDVDQVETDLYSRCFEFKGDMLPETTSRAAWSAVSTGDGFCREEDGGMGVSEVVCPDDEPCSVVQCQEKCERDSTCVAIEFREPKRGKGVCELHRNTVTQVEIEDGEPGICWKLDRTSTSPSLDVGDGFSRVGNGVCGDSNGNQGTTEEVCPPWAKCSVSKCAEECRENAGCRGFNYVPVQDDEGVCNLVYRTVSQLRVTDDAWCYSFDSSSLPQPAARELWQPVEGGDGFCRTEGGGMGQRDEVCTEDDKCTFLECQRLCEADPECVAIELRNADRGKGVCETHRADITAIVTYEDSPALCYSLARASLPSQAYELPDGFERVGAGQCLDASSRAVDKNVACGPGNQCSLFECAERCAAESDCSGVEFVVVTGDRGTCQFVYEEVSKFDSDNSTLCVAYNSDLVFTPRINSTDWTLVGRGVCRGPDGGFGVSDEVLCDGEPCNIEQCQDHCRADSGCKAIEFDPIYNQDVGRCELHFGEVTQVGGSNRASCYLFHRPSDYPMADESGWVVVGEGRCRNINSTLDEVDVGCDDDSKCTMDDCMALCKSTTECVGLEFESKNSSGFGLCELHANEISYATNEPNEGLTCLALVREAVQFSLGRNPSVSGPDASDSGESSGVLDTLEDAWPSVAVGAGGLAVGLFIGAIVMHRRHLGRKVEEEEEGDESLAVASSAV